MLSVVDLIRAGTLDISLAAYLLTAIGRGTSFLVGAVPGGAGKTTVMCALLNFVPAHCTLRAADSAPTLRRALAQRGGRVGPLSESGNNTQSGQQRPSMCYICHEIGDGPYFAYLWDRGAQDFFALPSAGYMIATNLHADTLEQCRGQLCDENGVRPADFHHCRLCMFLSVQGSWASLRRRIATVYESDGRSPHRLVWRWDRDRDRFERITDSALVSPRDADFVSIQQGITEMAENGIFTIQEVREHFLNSWNHKAG